MPDSFTLYWTYRQYKVKVMETDTSSRMLAYCHQLGL